MIMARGGARNRSGPAPDPRSRTSERKGYVLTALPSQGFDGEAPAFPLPRATRLTEAESRRFRARELAVWVEAWRTPQACAWSMESWRWSVIAEYCRLKTVVELAPDSNASLVAQLHRYRDQVGLTPAGLRENGWAIAKDEVGAKRAEKAEEPTPPDQPAPAKVRRLRG